MPKPSAQSACQAPPAPGGGDQAARFRPPAGADAINGVGSSARRNLPGRDRAASEEGRTAVRQLVQFTAGIDERLRALSLLRCSLLPLERPAEVRVCGLLSRNRSAPIHRELSALISGSFPRAVPSPEGRFPDLFRQPAPWNAAARPWPGRICRHR
jgi:hypothetical protein